jgi:hypothetical protein
VGKYSKIRSTEIAERLLEELVRLDDPDQHRVVRARRTGGRVLVSNWMVRAQAPLRRSRTSAASTSARAKHSPPPTGAMTQTLPESSPAAAGEPPPGSSSSVIPDPSLKVPDLPRRWDTHRP